MTRSFDMTATQPAPTKQVGQQEMCVRFGDTGASAKAVEAAFTGGQGVNPEGGAAM